MKFSFLVQSEKLLRKKGRFSYICICLGRCYCEIKCYEVILHGKSTFRQLSISVILNFTIHETTSLTDE